MTRRSAWECAVAIGSHKRVLCVLTVCLAVVMAGVPPAKAGGLASGGGVPTPGDQPPNPGVKEPGRDSWMSLTSYDWEPPNANLTDPNPSFRILELNESVEADVPRYVPEPFENLTKPDPNFVVEGINTGRESMAEGTVVIINATVNNTGYLPVGSVNVSFYAGTPSNQTLVATEVAVFDGFLSLVNAPWVATGLGNQTLFVVADPDDEVRELNESDNSNSTAVEVVSYYVPMPPNLVPDLEHVVIANIPVVNTPNTINVTVANFGEDTARNVTVEVVDASVNNLLDRYLIDYLVAGANNLRSISWTPQVEGSVEVQIKVDVDYNVTEQDESDNVGDALYYVLSSPPIWWPSPCSGVHQGVSIKYVGNLIIPYGDSCTFIQSQVVVLGNVLVYGQLILLQDSVFSLGYNYGSGMPYALEVFSGRLPNDPDGRIISSSSTITAIASTMTPFSLSSYYGFVFRAYGGSELQLAENSRVYYATRDVRTGKSGVQIETALATITSTSIRYGREDGLSCSSWTPSLFAGNTIERNGRKGVSTYDGCLINVQGGLVKLNEDGIFARTSATVSGVLVEDNRYSGITIDGASPTVTQSTILRNGQYGIRVDGLSSPAIYQNVRIETGGLALGVAVYGMAGAMTTPTIESNSLIIGNRVGAYIEGTQARIASNNFTDNAIGLAGVGTLLVAEENVFWPYMPETPSSGSHYGYVESEEVGLPMTPSTTQILRNEFNGVNGRPVWSVWLRQSVQTRLEGNNLYRQLYSDDIKPYMMVVEESSDLNISYNHLIRYGRAVRVFSSTGTFWRNSLDMRERYENIGDWVATGGEGIFIDRSPASGSEYLYLRANWINFTGYSVYLYRSRSWLEWNRIVFDYYPPEHAFRDYNPAAGTYRYEDLDRGAVLVYGSSTVIRRNYIEGNSYGVSMETSRDEMRQLVFSDAVIEFNTIVLNGYRAVATGMRDDDFGTLYDFNSASIHDNTISRSSGAGIVTSSWASVDVFSNTIEQTNGNITLCDWTPTETCMVRENPEYYAAVKIEVVPVPDGYSTDHIDVRENNLLYGNQSGIWVARGDFSETPDTSVEIHSNPVIRDFSWGIVDEGPRVDDVRRHAIYGNSLWHNLEAIQIRGNGRPLLQNNVMWGPRADVENAKGITFYGPRDGAYAYTYQTYNDIHDVDMGIFVYNVKYDTTPPPPDQVTLTISVDDQVSSSNYGIASSTHDQDCLDAATAGSSFDVSDSKFTGADVYGLYTRCASPQIKGYSEFTGNKHGGLIFGHNEDRTPLKPSLYTAKFNGNTENGLFLRYTTAGIQSSEFKSNVAGVLSQGTVVFEKFWDNTVQGNSESGMWLGTTATGVIGKQPGNPDPANKGSSFISNKQGIYLSANSIQVRENTFDENGLAVHARGDDDPAIVGNIMSSSSASPCLSGQVNDGIYFKDVNPQYEYPSIEGNTVNGVCLGIRVSNSGMGNPEAGGREDGDDYSGWILTSGNTIQNGKGEGGFFVEGSKVVSNLQKETAEADKVWEHRNKKAVLLADAVDFEAYYMDVTAYPPSAGVSINALTASGASYFKDSTVEGLPLSGVPSQPGGNLVLAGLGTFKFEGGSVTPIYPQRAVWVQQGSAEFDGTSIPKNGAVPPWPDDAIVFTSGSSGIIRDTKVRGYTYGIHFGYTGISSASSLTVTSTVPGATDIQAMYSGVYLDTYTGDVLVENSNIHGSQTGIFHGDDNVDGTAMMSGNTITGNNVGIKVLGGRPDIKDNAIQGNNIGISIMGGAPHIYGGAGTGDGNVITGNTQYGIFIGAGADADCSDVVCVKIEWNDIHGNTQKGIEAENPVAGGQPDYFVGTCNWWGEDDDTGPYDPSGPWPIGPPDWNPDGSGQYVSDYFYYDTWLTGSMADLGTSCTGTG